MRNEDICPQARDLLGKFVTSGKKLFPVMTGLHSDFINLKKIFIHQIINYPAAQQNQSQRKDCKMGSRGKGGGRWGWGCLVGVGCGCVVRMGFSKQNLKNNNNKKFSLMKVKKAGRSIIFILQNTT